MSIIINNSTDFQLKASKFNGFLSYIRPSLKLTYAILGIGLALFVICTFYASQPQYYRPCLITMFIAAGISYYCFVWQLPTNIEFILIIIPMILGMNATYLLAANDISTISASTYVSEMKKQNIQEISAGAIIYKRFTTEFTPLVTYNDQSRRVILVCKQAIKTTRFDDSPLVSLAADGTLLLHRPYNSQLDKTAYQAAVISMMDCILNQPNK